MHQNESARLKILEDLRILDTPPDPEFDELVALAAAICEAPIATVSLVDANRQWFKAKIGLKVSETARDISFCTHAIEQDEIFIVADAANDVRFRENPLVTKDPHIRFYAGAPIFDQGGYALGTLCVIDQVPRELNANQIKALRVLAKQVQRLIQLAATNRSLDAAKVNLRAYTDRMINLLENQQAGIVVEDRDRKITYINQKFLDLFGLKPGVFAGSGDSHHNSFLRLNNLFVGAADFATKSEELLSAAKPVSGLMLTIKDGYVLEQDYTPLFIAGELDGHMWTFRDVSERVNSEKIIEYQRLQLLESQKLSSLGEMAGGLAHEINNPLTVIYGRTNHLLEMAIGDKLSQTQIKEYAEDILNVTQRIIRIIKSLRSFARPGDLDPLEDVQVAVVVGDTLEFCRSKIQTAGVELRLPVLDTDYRAQCRAVQISQIILNLINNSYDAVNGKLGSWIEVDAVATSDEVLISVTDSGSGVPAELHEAIFSPFFTTKKSSQGTGLGLSISQKIAREHGGDLQIDATSRNTRFVLRLPAANSATG